MSPIANDQTILDQVLATLKQRQDLYGAAVQTSVFMKVPVGTRNLLTVLSFTRKDTEPPEPVFLDYSNGMIIRRSVSTDEFKGILTKLVTEGLLEFKSGETPIASPVTFMWQDNFRKARSEWIKWPADIFTLQPREQQNGSASYLSFVALNAPYYPTLEQVLVSFFAFRTQGWTNYFQGQINVVLPDYRVRISQLTVGLGFVRTLLESPFSKPSEFVAKVYAENGAGALVQESVEVVDSSFQINLSDRPKLASVVLISKATGEKLDEKTFQEGASWREPEVVFETSDQELEQMLLIGESETLEFRARLSDKTARLAKTAVAFANTKGGTIIFGVDDDHQIVGCDTKGIADTVTNILRSSCDPQPHFRSETLRHGDKNLLLIHIAESEGPIYTVRELGPFIRSNATNRTPTSREIEFLFQKRGSTIPALAAW